MSEIDDRDQDVDEVIQHLIEKLNNDDGLVNQRIREKLVQVGRPAVPALISALSSPSERIRWEATMVLGQIGDPRAAPALVSLLQDESIDVRWTAMDSLIALNQSAVLPLLFALRKNFESTWLRVGAYHILHVLKERGYLPPAVRRVFKALEGIEPVMEVPWAVEYALEELHIYLDDQEKGRTIMDIPIHAKVWCINEQAGTSTRLIIDPIKDKVTHLIVREKSFPYEERLVPVEHITESSPTLIRLDCTTDQLNKMDPFVETEFVPGAIPDMGYTMLWPYAAPEFPYMLLEHEKVPPNELAIKRGAEVLATDGPVGKVDEFLVEPASGEITHLVMREGHLWGQKEITIPISRIERIEKDKVYLKGDQAYIESLPAIPLHKREAHHEGA
jgi:sporulation protein YlmC with PRC-barrel domain